MKKLRMSLPRKTKHIGFDSLIVKDLADYTIINKPPFISSLDDRNDTQNILSVARKYNENYQLCHRLDKETSGIMVLSKNPEAYRHFAIQLEHREVKKIYHAILPGRQKFDDFEANEPLLTTSNKSRVDYKTGKPSLTLVSSLELFKLHTLVKCFPITGRMHQIRAHLAYHQASIIGDKAYGGEDIYLSELKKNYKIGKFEQENPMIGRVALHAYALAFKTIQGDVIEEQAPYPKDFSVMLKLLRKFN